MESKSEHKRNISNHLIEGESILPKTIRSKKRIAFCIIGIILVFIAQIQSNIGLEADPIEWTIYDTIAMVLFPIGYYLVIQGCYWWAKEKGRSGWWSLIGFIAPIGYYVLMRLEDRRRLGEIPIKLESKSIKFCPNCGHKLETTMNFCPNCRMEFNS